MSDKDTALLLRAATELMQWTRVNGNRAGFTFDKLEIDLLERIRELEPDVDPKAMSNLGCIANGADCPKLA